ncbi:MAG: ABC transporter substrate-binding protein [Bacteroidota bacterium]
MKYSFYLLLVIVFVSTSCESHLQTLVEEAPLISVQIPMSSTDSLRLPKAPEKMVSLAPNFTEIIYMLGAEEKLAARSESSTYPEKVYELPEVRGFPLPEVEDLMSYEPEVVLVSPEMKAQYIFPDSISTYTTLTDNLDQLFSAINYLGTLTAHESQAAQIVDSLSSLKNAISSTTKDEISYRTLILVRTDTLVAAGGSGMLNEMIEMAGGVNCFGEREEMYTAISPQEFLDAQPEFLIIPSRNTQVYGDLISRYPGFQYTEAEKQNHVFIVDPEVWFSQSPRVFDAGMDLTQMFHSHLVRETFLPGDTL